MLRTFADHVALAQKAFGVGATAWDGVFEPARLAEVLTFSFLEDIRLALKNSVYTYPPIELRGVGTLKRVEGGVVIFSPSSLLSHERDTKQFLLDGKFWQVLCQVDTEKEMFCVPLRPEENRIYSTSYLRDVGKCMITVIFQRKQADPFLLHTSLETLRNGLCLAIHDVLCSGRGFYLERIGTIFSSGHFELDRMLRAKIRAETNHDVNGKDSQYSFHSSESRRQTYNQGWYRSSDE